MDTSAYGRLVRHTWQFLSAWTFDPIMVTLLCVATGCYLLAAARVTRAHPSTPWPRSRSALFVSAIALLWLAILGPFGAWDDVFFWSHMTQHLIVTMLAAPLLVLSAPVLLALRVCPAPARKRYLVPVLRSRLAHALTHPLATWVLFAAVLMGTHFSPFYEFALTHSWAHDYVEHPLFLTAGVLFYYPLIGDNTAPRTLSEGQRVLSLALMMVPEAITGFFIYASPFVLYPFYRDVSRPFGPGPLLDQQLGGALMWSASMLLDTAWVALAARDWLRADARRTRRVDAAVARSRSDSAELAPIRLL